jgi:hypothetical protein
MTINCLLLKLLSAFPSSSDAIFSFLKAPI